MRVGDAARASRLALVTMLASGGGCSESQGPAAVVPEPPAGSRVGYHVAPTGSSSGAGTYDRPWDLATALDGAEGRLQPGDTVWVRGGTYEGTFRNETDGTASAPIVFRAYPGERATIDGRLMIRGSHTAFWGLEVMNSAPRSLVEQGIDVRAPGTKLINLVVHDAGKTGVGFWVEAPDSELHGSLIYNNGTNENLDHGVYSTNRTGMKHITDNVVFNNLAYGIHVYGERGQYIQNFVIDGNASFNNGSISDEDAGKPNLFVGGKSIVASGIRITNNVLLHASDNTSNLRLGYGDTQNRDLTLLDNLVVGGDPALSLRNWGPVTQSGNEYHDAPARPSGVRVVVRPNKYEAGRAHVIVGNWARQSAVAADLSRVLAVGDRYEVRSVQSFYGAPVASGTYGGGSISIPMGSIQPPRPIGRTTHAPPVTGPEFDVFVVTRVAN